MIDIWIIDAQPLQLSQRLLESTQGMGAVRVVTTDNNGASESPACHCQAMTMKYQMCLKSNETGVPNNLLLTYYSPTINKK